MKISFDYTWYRHRQRISLACDLNDFRSPFFGLWLTKTGKFSRNRSLKFDSKRKAVAFIYKLYPNAKRIKRKYNFQDLQFEV